MMPSPHDQPNLSPMPVYAVFDVEDMLTASTRLTDLLTQENELLAAMRLKELGALQDEKRALSVKVEAFQRMMVVDNQPIKTADPARRNLLLSTMENLIGLVEENLHLTRVAQHTNRLVMQTIVEAMSMQHRVGTYGRQGQTNHAPTGIPFSVNLNERA